MHPRKFLVPLLLMVFQVINSGYSAVDADTSVILDRRPMEKKEDLEDDFDVADDAEVGIEGVEDVVDGDEDEAEADDGLGARSRLMAAGRCVTGCLVSSLASDMSSSPSSA